MSMILVYTSSHRNTISPDYYRDWPGSSLAINPSDGLIYFTTLVRVTLILEGVTLIQISLH